MLVVDNIADLKRLVLEKKKEGLSLGYVPTMGYLHQGHISLIQAARQDNDYLVTSIFVNPTQFGPDEDFEAYPRDEKKDLEICRENKVDLVFLPKKEELYPEDYLTYVRTYRLTDSLCGQSRPNHFRGVTTILTKFFNLIEPDNVYFGKKDAQQLLVVKKMVRDLNFPINIIGCPTLRDEDGLATSSRNVYLSPEERKDARLIYKALSHAKEEIQAGETNIDSLKKDMEDIILEGRNNRIDYIEFVDTNFIESTDEIKKGECLVAVGVYTGSTHLIDNIFL